MQYDNCIAIVDGTLHQLNQIIFPYSELGNDVRLQENPDSYSLIYSLYGNSVANISFFVGACQISTNSNITQVQMLHSVIENNSRKYLQKISDQSLNSFDYQAAIKKWNISYVAIRDFQSIPRFTNDPTFKLVFKNDKVAIFRINH
mgnify:CR=1 FL=1